MESTWVARLTAITLSMAIFGAGLAWLDGRHASASDVSRLTESIEKERLSRIEFEIEELERMARGIKRMSVEEQATPQVQAREQELKARRERYLRKREELLLEMGEK